LSNCKIEVKEKVSIKDNSRNKILSLRDISGIRNTLLLLPTFNQHFEGINVEAEYILGRDADELKKESLYLGMHGLDITVDFTSMLNFYPKLTLLDNLPERYRESYQTIESIFEKMSIIGSRKAIFSLHRMPENRFTVEETVESFRRNMEEIAGLAQRYEITIYIESNPWKISALIGIGNVCDLIKELNRSNVKLVLNTCHCLGEGEDLVGLYDEYREHIGMVKISAPYMDHFGQYYDHHLPVKGSQFEDDIRSLIRHIKEEDADIILCCDAVYSGWDELWTDLRLVEG